MNYTFRMHDPRVGRFFAVDPLAGEYSWNSPYAFSENRVIDGVDLEGLEFSKHWNKDNLIKRAVELVKNPINIDQGSGGTCVLAAVTYLWIKNDSKGFTKTLMNLYFTGKAKYNQFVFHPGEDLMNTDPRETSLTHDKSFSVDWIILSSMQQTINKQQNKWDYDGVENENYGNDGNDNATTQYLFRRLLNLKDVKTVVRNPKDSGETYLKNMDKKFNNGYDIVIAGTGDMFDSNASSESGHAVTYMGNFKDLGIGLGGEKWFSFDIQTWGGDENFKTMLISESKIKEQFINYTQGKKK